MRFTLILLLISMVAVLGCNPAPKANANSEIAGAETGPYIPGAWIEDWDLALASSKELDRPILINFTGSDWCGWCVRLKNEVFSQKEFDSYAKENLVLLKLDFPRSIAQSDELKAQNSTLQKQFAIQGFPTIVLVNSEGKEIKRTGYREGGAAAYVEHIKDLLK